MIGLCDLDCSYILWARNFWKFRNSWDCLWALKVETLLITSLSFPQMGRINSRKKGSRLSCVFLIWIRLCDCWFFNGLDWVKAVDPTLVSNSNLSSLSRPLGKSLWSSLWSSFWLSRCVANYHHHSLFWIEVPLGYTKTHQPF